MDDGRQTTSGSTEPPRPLVIWSTGYGRGFGGAEQMVNALIRRRPSDPQILITDGDPRGPLPSGVFAALPDGVEVRADTFPNPLLSTGPRQFVVNCLSYLKASRGLWHFFRRRRPAIVHQHFVSLDVFLLALYKYFFGYRLVITFCGGDLSVARRSALARVKIRTALHCADGVTAVSEEMATVLRTRFRARDVVFIPNGVDVAEVGDAATRVSPVFPAGHFVFVGRLHRDKRVTEMVGVFKQAIDAGCEQNLYLIGDGPERDAVTQRIAREGVGDRVFLLGALSHHEALASLGQARCLLLLSSEEGCPNVVLEAMALGVPTIATRVGGLEDLIVDGRTGYLVPPDRLEHAVGPMLQLSRDARLASLMGQRGREMARHQLSLESAAQKYRALYESLLVRTRSAGATSAAECSGISSQ